MYLIIRCTDCKFVSSVDVDNSKVTYTTDFDNVQLFDSEYDAVKYGSYCVGKVAILKLCDLF